jgi:hypothetical protein
LSTLVWASAGNGEGAEEEVVVAGEGVKAARSARGRTGVWERPEGLMPEKAEGPDWRGVGLEEQGALGVLGGGGVEVKGRGRALCRSGRL